MNTRTGVEVNSTKTQTPNRIHQDRNGSKQYQDKNNKQNKPGQETKTRPARLAAGHCNPAFTTPAHSSHGSVHSTSTAEIHPKLCLHNMSYSPTAGQIQ